MDRNSENSTLNADSNLDLDPNFQPGTCTINDESGSLMANGNQAGPSLKQTKKRVKDPESWKQNSRKRRRTLGAEYTTSKGKTVPKRTFKKLQLHK